MYLYLFIFGLTFTFQLLDKPWSPVSSLLPPGTCLRFLSRIGFSISTARRFSSNFATHALYVCSYHSACKYEFGENFDLTRVSQLFFFCFSSTRSISCASKVKTN